MSFVSYSFRPFKDELSRPKCTLVTNAARTSSGCKCCYRHSLLRLQNKTTSFGLFWSRFSAWIAALTPTRCTRKAFDTSVHFGRDCPSLNERKYPRRHKGHLTNPIIRTFSRKRMHLFGEPEEDPCLSLYKPTVSERRPVQRLWCLIIMLIEASVFTRGETESFFEGPVEVGEVIEA